MKLADVPGSSLSPSLPRSSRWPAPAVTLVAAAALLAGCATDGDDATDDRAAIEHERSSAVLAKGARVLAMDVGAGPTESLDAAVAKAKAAGVTTVVLNYDWSQLEPAAFQYQNAKLIADNAYYSTAPHAMNVILNIRPVAGACRVVPPDLANLAWSDPVMTTRFGYLLSWIRGHLLNVNVQVMSIGTEIDTHLAVADYPAYKVFFETARQNARSRWSAALPVGTAVTWDGLTTPGAEQAAILDLDEHADHVLFTYYGISPAFTVKDPYFGPVADLYSAFLAIDGNAKTRGRPVDLIEAGYPTSSALASSEAKQQTFVSTMFGIWDAYAPRLGALVFTWQTDLTEYSAQVVAIGGWGGGGCQGPAGPPPPAPAAPTITPRGTPGTRTWQYYVVAINSNGNSEPGPIATLATGAVALSATSFNRLTWAPVAGATGYKVLRFASGGTPASTGQLATTTATTLDDTGLTSSTFIFQEFIRTLGYRTAASPPADKLGFVQLGTEAHARGW